MANWVRAGKLTVVSVLGGQGSAVAATAVMAVVIAGAGVAFHTPETRADAVVVSAVLAAVGAGVFFAAFTALGRVLRGEP